MAIDWSANDSDGTFNKQDGQILTAGQINDIPLDNIINSIEDLGKQQLVERDVDGNVISGTEEEVHIFLAAAPVNSYQRQLIIKKLSIKHGIPEENIAIVTQDSPLLANLSSES